MFILSGCQKRAGLFRRIERSPISKPTFILADLIYVQPIHPTQT